MNNQNIPALPHHSLIAYQVAVQLLLAVRDAQINDADLRKQALKAAKSTCLNCAEGAGRTSRKDKARVFGIARGEVVELAAALEIAGITGDCAAEDAARCVALATRVSALLSGFIRRV